MSIRKMTQTVERCFTESISNKSNKNKSIVNRICAIRVNDARKEYVAWLMAKMRIPALSLGDGPAMPEGMRIHQLDCAGVKV